MLKGDSTASQHKSLPISSVCHRNFWLRGCNLKDVHVNQYAVLCCCAGQDNHQEAFVGDHWDSPAEFTVGVPLGDAVEISLLPYLRGNWKTGDLQTPCFPVGIFITIMCLNDIHLSMSVNSIQINSSSFISIILNLSGFIWVNSSLVGGLGHFLILHTLGISSSQLTFTPSFFRGVGQPPTRFIQENQSQLALLELFVHFPFPGRHLGRHPTRHVTSSS